jgi:hypothetical protein
MSAMTHWNAKHPDRMESHQVHRHTVSPLCTLQELDPEDFAHTMCNELAEEERRLDLHTDERSFTLNKTFVRAHGLPQGEYTIFSSAMEVSAVHSGLPRSRAR